MESMLGPKRAAAQRRGWRRALQRAGAWVCGVCLLMWFCVRRIGLQPHDVALAFTVALFAWAQRGWERESERNSLPSGSGRSRVRWADFVRDQHQLLGCFVRGRQARRSERILAVAITSLALLYWKAPRHPATRCPTPRRRRSIRAGDPSPAARQVRLSRRPAPLAHLPVRLEGGPVPDEARDTLRGWAHCGVAGGGRVEGGARASILARAVLARGRPGPTRRRSRTPPVTDRVRAGFSASWRCACCSSHAKGGHGTRS